MPRVSLEGANCADIRNPDYFFESSRDKVRLKAARHICGRCVVLDACRAQALNGPRPQSGVIAGLTAREIQNARAWQNYESGIREAVPTSPRPDWLPRSEAAETAEQTWIEDEEGVTR
jgi:hypothetical protein